MYSRISGTGRYLPETILTSSGAGVLERTGIVSRHVVANGQTTTDLAEAAARRALASAGIEPADIDLVVVGTTTPDVVFPNLGCLLQDRLKVSGFPAFSIEAGASGFIYALSVADRFIVAGQSRHALVIGAETQSRFSPHDAAGATLFADGAGAVVLEPAQAEGSLSCRLGSDASVAGDERVPQISREAELEPVLASLKAAVGEMLAEQAVTIDDVAWLIPHQSSHGIIERTSRNLGIPAEKTVLTLREHGNAGAASVPLALDVAIEDGRVVRGDLLVLESVGGGLAWGGAVLRY
jgi:3-oxoacyl-[acyl-carrier-protein] synthase-3